MGLAKCGLFGPPLESSGSGLLLETRCYAVFAFVKKAVVGLAPGETYDVSIALEIATDTPATPCNPESTSMNFSSRNALGSVVYGAATSREPILTPVDAGVQLEGGLLRSGFLGDISTSEKRCGPQGPLPIWEFRLHTGDGMTVTADAAGQAWLTAGVVADWNSIYLSRVSATFTPVPDPRFSNEPRPTIVYRRRTRPPDRRRRLRQGLADRPRFTVRHGPAGSRHYSVRLSEWTAGVAGRVRARLLAHERRAPVRVPDAAASPGYLAAGLTKYRVVLTPLIRS